MKKHDRMKGACEARRIETNGKCAEECLEIGWCKHVYKSVEPKKRKGNTSGIQSGSGAIAPTADD